MTGRKIVPITALSAAVLLAAGLLMTLFGGAGGDADGWKGYHLLLVPEESAAGQDIPERLTALGLGPVLSYETVRVRISDFAGGREIPLSDLDAQLYPGDPRRDPFLESLPRLFHQNGYRLYWLSDRISSRTARNKIASLNLAGAVFPSWRYVLSPWAFLVLALCGVLHLLFSARDRVALIISLAPGLLLAAAGGNFTALAGFVLLYGAVHLLPPGIPSRWEALLIPAAGSLLLGAFFMVRGCGLPSGLLLITASLALLLTVRFRPDSAAVTGPVRFRNPRVTEHPLFEPLFLGKSPPRGARRFSPGRLALLGVPILPLLVVAIVLLSRWGGETGPGLSWPVPTGTVRPILPQSVAADLEREGETPFPGAASYLAHRFYQDGLLFGVRWGSPFVKFNDSISTFSESGGRIVKNQGMPFPAVPEDWSGYLRVLDGDPLFALYRRQGGLVDVELTEGRSGSLLPYRWWDYLLLWLLAVLAGIPFLLQVFSGKVVGVHGRFAAAWRKS